MRAVKSAAHMDWAMLQARVLNDQNGLTLILTVWVNLWCGPDISSVELNPGEVKLRRPAWMSDKVFHSTKARLEKLGLLEVRTFRQRTICRLTDACKRLLHLHTAWGETEGETSCPRSPGSPTCSAQFRQNRGETRGVTSKCRAKLSKQSGGIRGGTWDECMPSTNAQPPTLARLQPDPKVRTCAESEGETCAEVGQNTRIKDSINEESSSLNDFEELSDSLWKDVSPCGRTLKPQKDYFKRKCQEWLNTFTEDTVRALIWYANRKVTNDYGYIGYITSTIHRGGATHALSLWRTAMDQRQKALAPPAPPKTQEEISRNAERFHQQFALLKAKLRIDEAGIPPQEAALDSHLAQSGQPTPCGHGPLSGAGQGLRPLEPREDEDKGSKA